MSADVSNFSLNFACYPMKDPSQDFPEEGNPLAPPEGFQGMIEAIGDYYIDQYQQVSNIAGKFVYGAIGATFKATSIFMKDEKTLCVEKKPFRKILANGIPGSQDITPADDDLIRGMHACTGSNHEPQGAQEYGYCLRAIDFQRSRPRYSHLRRDLDEIYAKKLNSKEAIENKVLSLVKYLLQGIDLEDPKIQQKFEVLDPTRIAFENRWGENEIPISKDNIDFRIKAVKYLLQGFDFTTKDLAYRYRDIEPQVACKESEYMGAVGAT